MILNRQRDVRITRPALESFLRRVRRHLNLGEADVTICLVSDAEIARMNESFRKKKGPTDVLSFPAIERRKPLPLPARRKRHAPAAAARQRRFSPGPANDRKSVIKGQALALERNFLGDIAISPSTARRNAKKLSRTLHTELQILILHGVLHLLGYDHETDEGQMDRVEQRLRRRLGLA
jgi:probable rRNA maturation factor